MLNIVIVIVIYCTKYNESATVRSLFSSDLNRNINLRILLYDNSPISQKIDGKDLPKHIYVHNPLNGGLAEAYNYALSMIDDQDSWLLLLDQDSRLPTKFIKDLFTKISEINDASIVAIAPHVFSNNKILSPVKVSFGGRLRGVSENFTGVCEDEIMAINSGIAIKASFVKQLGGFNGEFWLDYLDYWLCHMIYRSKKKIYVSSAIIDHNLSVANYNNLSEQRAQNILNSEVLFYHKYKPWYEQTIYLFRLVCRCVKQYAMVENKQIAHNTLCAVWRSISGR